MNRRAFLRGLLATTSLGAVPWREASNLITVTLKYPTPDAPAEYSGFYSLYHTTYEDLIEVYHVIHPAMMKALSDAQPRP